MPLADERGERHKPDALHTLIRLIWGFVVLSACDTEGRSAMATASPTSDDHDHGGVAWTLLPSLRGQLLVSGGARRPCGSASISSVLANLRAERLLAAMLSDEEYAQYRQHWYVDVPSPYYIGRVYPASPANRVRSRCASGASRCGISARGRRSRCPTPRSCWPANSSSKATKRAIYARRDTSRSCLSPGTGAKSRGMLVIGAGGSALAPEQSWAPDKPARGWTGRVTARPAANGGSSVHSQ